MYKLLIADDEPKIRRGLKKLDWADIGIEVIGEASTGEEALKKIEELEPHLALLDINMPIMSGLELIRALKEKDNACLIIIISGYDEFEYAREAIQNNVFDYLLKPVDRKKLFQIVEKGIQELAEKQKQEKLIEWTNTQILNQQGLIQNRFFKQWIAGSLTDYQIQQNLDILGIHLEVYQQMTVFRILPIREGKGRALSGELLEFCILNIVDETLQCESIGLCIATEENTYVLLQKEEEIPEDIIGKIRENIHAYLSLHIIYKSERMNRGGKEGLSEFICRYNQLLTEVKDDYKHSPLVQLAIEYVQKNYQDVNLSIEDVAKYARVSVSHLSKLLRKELGYSYTDLLQEVRIEKAVQLMQDPMLRMYDIAEQVGYSTQHYFSAAFKKVKGVSPVNFRRDLIHE